MYLMKGNVVYDSDQDSLLLKVIPGDKDYSHILDSPDQSRFRDISKFLVDGGASPYLGGSAVRNFLESPGRSYNDIDVLAVAPSLGKCESFSSLHDLFYGEVGKNPELSAQIGGHAYLINYNFLEGTYMHVHTRVRQEVFKLKPIRTLKELKEKTRVAPIHLCFISEKNFKDSLKRRKK